jgi:hypothetical protein
MTSRLEERFAALATKSPAQLRDMWERLRDWLRADVHGGKD